MSYEFGLHLKQFGIVSQLTPPGTPQRNGVSERHNRTLLDMVQTMMSLTNLPLSFWDYALETAAFTLNSAPSKSIETTPYELRMMIMKLQIKLLLDLLGRTEHVPHQSCTVILSWKSCY